MYFTILYIYLFYFTFDREHWPAELENPAFKTCWCRSFFHKMERRNQWICRDSLLRLISFRQSTYHRISHKVACSLLGLFKLDCLLYLGMSTNVITELEELSMKLNFNIKSRAQRQPTVQGAFEKRRIADFCWSPALLCISWFDIVSPENMIWGQHQKRMTKTWLTPPALSQAMLDLAECATIAFQFEDRLVNTAI